PFFGVQTEKASMQKASPRARAIMWSAGVTASAVVPTLGALWAWRSGVQGSKLFLLVALFWAVGTLASNWTSRVGDFSKARRALGRRAAGTAAGAGLVLGSGRRLSALADEGKHNKCEALARPIPHITGPGHFFFPGPPDGSAPSTFPNFPFAGFDPSTITDFQGVIAQADLDFDGMGTNLETGQSVAYHFHTDWR